MGGKLGLFSVCQSKQREEDEAPPVSPDGQSRLVGPSGDIIDNPLSGYEYFSPEDLQYYEELLKAEEGRKSEVQAPLHWQAGEFLGQGSFGRVIFAANMDTGELFAVKQIPISGFSYETVHERVQEIQMEVDILSKLSHRNIVRYMGSSRDEQNLNIFLEYVAGGSIASLLAKYGKFKESLVRVYTKQILEGLEYLHYHKIVHRDIKGANVLVNNEGVCKVADFGAAKQFKGVSDFTQFKSLRGTINWMAPEVMKQEGHGRYADIWSLGCTVLEMLTGKPPWYYKTNPVTSTQIAVFMHVGNTNDPPELPEEISLDAKSFILACLKRNPSERPNVRKLLMHPFIAGPQAVPVVRGAEDPAVDVFVSSSTKFSSTSIRAHNKYDTLSMTSVRSVVPGEDSSPAPPAILEEVKVPSDQDLQSRDPAHNLQGPFGSIITASFKPPVQKEKTQEEELVLRRKATGPEDSCKPESDSSYSNSSSSGNGSYVPGSAPHIIISLGSPEPQKKAESQKHERRSDSHQKEQRFSIVCVS